MQNRGMEDGEDRPHVQKRRMEERKAKAPVQRKEESSFPSSKLHVQKESMQRERRKDEKRPRHTFRKKDERKEGQATFAVSSTKERKANHTCRKEERNKECKTTRVLIID
jgi:hypothetical protein